jgi:hypothetical protein
MKYPTIEEIINIENFRMTIRFSEGTVKEVDLSPLLTKEVFEPLNQDAFFKQAQIDQGGFGIIWNDEIDISEAYLWDKGQTLGQIVV